MEKLYSIPREKLSQISHKFTKVGIEFLGSTEEKTGDMRGGKTSRMQLHAHSGQHGCREVGRDKATSTWPW